MHVVYYALSKPLIYKALESGTVYANWTTTKWYWRTPVFLK